MITIFVDTTETAEWISVELIARTGVAPFKTTLFAKMNLLEAKIVSFFLKNDNSLLSVIRRGLSLNTTLNVEVSVKGASDPAYSFTGPGAVDMNTTENPNRVDMAITEPGIYVFSAEVTDENGNVHSDDVAILANNRPKMDELYHGKWNGMKTAMIAGDIEQAVSYFTDSQKDIFREIYTIIEPEMAQLAMDMQDIELIYQKNRVAEYRLRRDVIFKDEPVTISFYVYFQQGGDGIWRIRDY